MWLLLLFMLGVLKLASFEEGCFDLNCGEILPPIDPRFHFIPLPTIWVIFQYLVIGVEQAAATARLAVSTNNLE